MNTYTVQYRSFNGHVMQDTVRADSTEEALAKVKDCGLLVFVEFCRLVEAAK